MTLKVQVVEAKNNSQNYCECEFAKLIFQFTVLLLLPLPHHRSRHDLLNLQLPPPCPPLPTLLGSGHRHLPLPRRLWVPARERELMDGVNFGNGPSLLYAPFSAPPLSLHLTNTHTQAHACMHAHTHTQPSD